MAADKGRGGGGGARIHNNCIGARNTIAGMLLIDM